MKIWLKILAGVAIVLTVNGCKSAPACDSSDAKQTVMEISGGELKKRLGSVVDYRRGGSLARNMREAEVERMYKTTNIQLVDIRTDSKDDEIEKTTCSASIAYANNKVDITYELSKTSEGKLYVKVYGLNYDIISLGKLE